MVVCKFFQLGNCRYGQSCRFEHIYGSKYTYNANAQASAAAPAVTDEQLSNQVQLDVQAALRGGQWLLSSYAPFKEKATFPGITDLSPEEARLFIYEAKANNNLEQAVTYMNNLFSEARQKYEQLLLKNQNIMNILRSLYKGEPVSSPFGAPAQSNASFNSAPSSVFRSAVQNTSIFGTNNTTPSIFAQSNFAPPAPDPAKSIFAQATQSAFTANPQSIFSQNNNQNNQSFMNQSDSSAKSIFAQGAQTAFTPSQPQSAFPPSVFAQTAQQSAFNQTPQSVFTPSAPQSFSQSQSNAASIFASANATPSIFSQSQPTNQSPFQSSNAFQKPVGGNIFQQAAAASGSDSAVYSKMEDLSPKDIEAFNSEDFKMGFVPDLPPPHSLCF